MQIYLDYNASTPLLPEVREALLPFLEETYGNPSTSHWAAQGALAAIESARDSVAAMLNADSTEIVWTSGGTESNNYAIQGSFFQNGLTERFHIVTTGIEHPAVSVPCQFLRKLGARVTVVPVDGAGMVDVDEILGAIQSETRLISVMHANNEVGTIQPISEIGAIARERGILLHVDAAQSAGKVPIDVQAMNVDLLSVAGHKLYAPKGVGALYVRSGVELSSLMLGAGHESGRRAGTENTPWIVALGTAAQSAMAFSSVDRVLELRDYFWRELQAIFQDQIVLNGHPTLRLPNTLNVSFLGQVGHEILDSIPEVAASTGSACHEGTVEISPVLKAMHVSQSRAQGAIRFSLGKPTTRAEIDVVLERFRTKVPC